MIKSYILIKSILILFIERKKALKYWVLKPGAQKNLSFIKSPTNWILFNVLSRTYLFSANFLVLVYNSTFLNGIKVCSRFY